VPILAFADRPEVAAELSLWQGVIPVLKQLATSTDALIEQIVDGVRGLGYAGAGDRIVIVGSVPRAGGTRAVFLEVQTLS
jgi:pyruvate kinase